jgi:hypothetical protein
LLDAIGQQKGDPYYILEYPKSKWESILHSGISKIQNPNVATILLSIHLLDAIGQQKGGSILYSGYPKSKIQNPKSKFGSILHSGIYKIQMWHILDPFA